MNSIAESSKKVSIRHKKASKSQAVNYHYPSQLLKPQKIENQHSKSVLNLRSFNKVNLELDQNSLDNALEHSILVNSRSSSTI